VLFTGVAGPWDGTSVNAGRSAQRARRGDVQVRRVSDGSLTQSLRDPTDLVRDPFDGVNEIAYSSDGQHVAGVTDQGLIVIWQVSDGRIVRTIG